jgi:hypothetical protein
MGRGGDDGSVPTVKLRRSPYAVPLHRFRAPGGGFKHGKLLGHGADGRHNYSAPVRRAALHTQSAPPRIPHTRRLPTGVF